jgi:hypothetical protein
MSVKPGGTYGSTVVSTDEIREPNLSSAKRQRTKSSDRGRFSAETEDVAALMERGWRVSEKQRETLYEIADRHDLTGRAWAAAIIRATPSGEDPFRAVLEADRTWQEQRESALTASEKAASRHRLEEAMGARRVMAALGGLPPPAALGDRSAADAGAPVLRDQRAEEAGVDAGVEDEDSAPALDAEADALHDALLRQKAEAAALLEGSRAQLDAEKERRIAARTAEDEQRRLDAEKERRIAARTAEDEQRRASRRRMAEQMKAQGLPRDLWARYLED